MNPAGSGTQRFATARQQPAPGIAVICLAYLGDPAGVRRLAAYFAAAQARVFVHVDARVPIEPYVQGLAGLANATVVAARDAIHWGGFSLVRTVMRILRLVRSAGPYARYCLITEDSVPLVSPALLRRLLEQDRDYIQLDPQPEGPVMERYTGFYYLDSAATNPRSLLDARCLEPHLVADLTRAEALRARGKYPLPRLFHGATWWALSGKAIETVLNAYEGNLHLRESFEFSLIPEEQFVHSVLGNAGPGFRFAPFMHADFSREPKPFVFCDPAEIQALRSMPFLFARKVPLVSAAIDGYFRGLIDQTDGVND